MDLSKLTPAPWFDNDGYRVHAPTADVDKRSGDVLFEGKHLAATGTDSAFVALARNAFDVMMRRGWYAAPIYQQGEVIGWNVLNAHGALAGRDHHRSCATTFMLEGWPFSGLWSDPFTALVEADKWYTEHVESPKERS